MIQKLGKYTIVEKLGEGSMGAVYKAYDSVLDRHVAIKTMAEGIEWEPEMKLRFYREAKLAAALHHPNIVIIHDLGEEGKTTYIVMELLEGKDLKKIIQLKDTLSLERKLSIMAQVSDGLNHAHKFGIVHRDIKPSNIIVTSSGNVKILDFGIARLPTSDLTRSGVRLGTPVYMAPEQIRDQACDQRTDIFSAGIVFYELIAYVHPFRDKNVVKTLDNILFQNPVSLEERFPNTPPGLWVILSNCLAKDPTKRSANMGDVGQACRNLLDDLKAASKRMTRELEELLPRLRQASESSGSTPRIRKLIWDAQELLGDARKSDFLSLRFLLAALGEESAALQRMAPSPEPKAEAPLPAAELPSKEEVPPENALPQTPLAPAAPPQPSPHEIRGKAALERGKSLLNEGRLDEALDQFRQAMGDIGSHPELVSALSETRKRIEEQKRARIAQQLDSARRLIVEKRFAEAIQTIDEVLQTEIDRTEAMELRYQAMTQLQAEKASEARKEEGEKAKDGGFRLLSEKKYSEALAELRRASELLGEDATIKSAIGEAIRELQAQELKAKMDEGIANARQLLGEGDFARARSQTEILLKLSPGNAEASELLSKINQFEAEKEKKNRIAELLIHAKGALHRNEFALADLAVREVLQIEPRNAEAAGLLQQIDQAKQQQYKHEVITGLLSKAEVALNQCDFSQATGYVDEVMRVEPQSAEAQAFLERIRHTEAEKRRHDEIAALLLGGREALKQQNFTEAADKARQVLDLDSNSTEAQNLFKLISQAQEIQNQEKIAALLAKCQEARSRQEFVEASNAANEVLSLDPQNKKAKSLLKTIAKEDQKRQKEQTKAESQRAQREQQGELDETRSESLEITQKLPRFKWTLPRMPVALTLIGLIAAVVVIAAVFIARSGRDKVPTDPLAAAQESLDQRDFAKAIALAEGSAARGDPRAKAIMDQAVKGQAARWIDGQLSQAQDLRAQGKLDESKALIVKILDGNPQDERARRALSEIEAALLEKSATEQQLNKDILSLIESARALLKNDKLDEARKIIDKILKLRPDLPEARTLDRNWRKKQQELDKKRVEDEKREAANKMIFADANNMFEQAQSLFREGKYDGAESMLEGLLKSVQIQEVISKTEVLLGKTQEARQCLRSFVLANDKGKYGEALELLRQLTDINPSDPSAKNLLLEVTENKNKARAYLTVLPGRGVDRANLLLDGNPIGKDGQVTRQPITIDQHRVVARASRWGEHALTTDKYLANGENLELVYDGSELRKMNQKDKSAPPPKPQEETSRKFNVSHPHKIGFIGRGKCTGTLTISSNIVQYAPSEGDHGWLWDPRSIVSITMDGEKTIVIKTNDNKKEYTVNDAKDVRAILEFWEKVRKTIK